jgi:hypothetical protein
MGYLEVLGVLWVLTQVLGQEAFMVCVSGCA